MNSNKFYSFDYDGAIKINKQRIEYLKELNLDLSNKKVLETGMGARGDISRFLKSNGADLYVFDARQLNCDEFKKRNPDIKNVYCIDFNHQNCLDTIDVDEYDYIVCFGTLYHLSNPENALKEMLKKGKKLILSTIVKKGGKGWNFVKENKKQMNQSFDGHGCRPNLNFLRTKLKENYKFVDEIIQPDYQDSNIRHAFYCYND